MAPMAPTTVQSIAAAKGVSRTCLNRWDLPAYLGKMYESSSSSFEYNVKESPSPGLVA